MELLLGSHVREHGARVGRLAGFELEPAERRIRRIIFSADGALGPQAMTRPLTAIGHVRKNGEVELRIDVDTPPMAVVSDVMLLSRATHVRRRRGAVARLTGIDVNPADRALQSVLGKAHWWSRPFSLAASDLDCSTPGEIRAASPHTTRAA